MGVPGLRLNLGGAPETPHVIDELPGLYWATHPTPVDVIDGMDIEKAKRLHDEDGVPLAFEDIADEATAESHREKYREELRIAAAAGGVVPAPVGGEADVRQAQTQAIAPQPEPIPGPESVNSEPQPDAEGHTESE